MKPVNEHNQIIRMLGWIIFGTCMALASTIIALFPKKLKKKNPTPVNAQKPALETVPKLSGTRNAAGSIKHENS
jgi:hypothetical protein